MLLPIQWLNVELLHEVAFENIRLVMRQQDERQKHKPANHCAIEQYGYDGVFDDGLFLEDVVEAEENG